jgi:hypothetical protein
MTATTDPPARLLGPGRVLLTGTGVRLAACMAEAVLRSERRNGRAPAAGLARLAQVLALAAPAEALRLPELLRVAGPEVAYACSAAQAEAELAAAAGRDAPWQRGQAGIAEAAQSLGITRRGARWLCQAGRLRAARNRVTGAWQIDRASIAAYARWREAGRGQAA